MNAISKPETPTFHFPDFQAAKSVVETMIGCNAVGVADDQEVSCWNSPLLRAQLEALMGRHIFAAAYRSNPGDMHMRAMASLLRTLADTIDPPAAQPALVDTPAGKALDQIGECFGAAVRAGLLHQMQKVTLDGRAIADIVQEHLMPIEQIVHDVLGSK